MAMVKRASTKDFNKVQDHYADFVQKALTDLGKKLIERHDTDFVANTWRLKQAWQKEVAKLKNELHQLRTVSSMRSLRHASNHFVRLSTPEEEHELEVVEDLDADEDSEGLKLWRGLPDRREGSPVQAMSLRSSFEGQAMATRQLEFEGGGLPSPGCIVMDPQVSDWDVSGIRPEAARQKLKAWSPQTSEQLLSAGPSGSNVYASSGQVPAMPSNRTLGSTFTVESMGRNPQVLGPSASPSRQIENSTLTAVARLGGDIRDRSASADSVVPQIAGSDETDTVFQLRQELEDVGNKIPKARGSMEGRSSLNVSSSLPMPRETESRKEDSCMSHFIIAPASAFRTTLDLIGCCLILYTSVVYPFVFAWEGRIPEALMTVSLWISCPFWTFQLVVSFFQAYYTKDGELEERLRKCAAHYLRSYFMFDLITLLCEWVAVIAVLVSDGSSTELNLNFIRLVRLVKTSALVRLATVARIVRLMYLASTGPRLAADLSSKGAAIFFIVRTLGFLLWLNHMLCCVWFMLGETNGDTGITWLDMPLGEVETKIYKDQDLLYQYTTALHWAFTQMTPASMQVNAVNSGERIWTIFCLMLGLIINAGLIGQLSSKFVELNLRQRERSRRLEKVRTFLDENRISSVLAIRVTKHIEDRMTVHRRLTEEDVPDIGELSDTLRKRLRQEVFSPYMAWHPLFSLWSYTDPGIIRMLCGHGDVCFQCLSPGDSLFLRDTEATCAYLCLTGHMVYSLEYYVSARGDLDNATSSVPVEAGRWLCEASLWLEFLHPGGIEAIGVCEFVALPFEGILRAITSHPLGADLVLPWAVAYQNLLSQCTLEEAGLDPTALDLYTPMGAVILSLAESQRRNIGSCVIKQLDESSLLRTRTARFLQGQRKGAAELQEEVRADKSILFVDGPNNFYRTVSVLALRIRVRETDKILVQLAKRGTGGKQSSWLVSVALPGTKMKTGADAFSIAEGFVQDVLTPLTAAVQMDEVSIVTEENISTSYGVKSQYIRSIVKGSVSTSHLDACKLKNLPQPFSAFGAFVQQDQAGKKVLYGVMTEGQFTHFQQHPSELAEAMNSLMPILYQIDSSKSSIGRFFGLSSRLSNGDIKSSVAAGGSTQNSMAWRSDGSGPFYSSFGGAFGVAGGNYSPTRKTVSTSDQTEGSIHGEGSDALSRI